jgi:hypothetical protein
MADMENKEITTEQSSPDTQTRTPDLSGYFNKLSEDLGKQMERYFTSNSKKEADNFGLTAEQMQEAAKDFLAKNKSKEQTLIDENVELKNQLKQLKSNSTLNDLFNKLEVNTELKDDLLKMVNVNDFYNEKDELKTEELEKSLINVITRIPSFKKVKEVPNVNFGQDLKQDKQTTKKAKSMEDVAREIMGLAKKD